MTRLIPESFIEDLLARLDVVDVVDNRVKLKKTGKNYSACCPFHNEKTPSFSVSPDKQFYHCFGCGASGDAIKFVMEFEGLSFPEAVDNLAGTVGLEVPKVEAGKSDFEQQKQKPLLALMEKATLYYQQMLRQHEQRQVAIDYLKKRGLSGQAAQFFEIGYAPGGWDNLIQALGAQDDRTVLKQLISCGMLVEREDGRCYDRFRDRIMFPIRDIRGRVIAFGGRVLTDEKPKYLNSPETPIFHKGQELYGLYEARKIRQKLTRIVVVEGYMDVVALAEHGIHYAVATLGTATSEQHLRRLFKIVSEVIFCFDGDSAGRAAAARAMEIVLPVLADGLQVRFLFLPDGEDPDSVVRQEGRSGFEQRLNEAMDLPDFLFQHLKQQVDFNSLQGKARLDQMAAPLIARLPQGTLRRLMVKQLEVELGTSSSAMQQVATETSPSVTAIADIAPVMRAPIVIEAEPQHHRMDDSNALTPIVRKALQAVVKKPSLVQQLTLPDAIEGLVPETEDEYQLLAVLRLLCESPQSGSIGLLIQCTGLPYLDKLVQLADQSTLVAPALGDVSSALERMQMRPLRLELERYEKKFHERKPLSAEEKKTYFQLQQKLHQITKNRGRH